MLNLCWGGVETNQVGTQEFVDFCTQVNADPLMCVNFESDGRAYWEKDPKGSVRHRQCTRGGPMGFVLQ